MIIERDLGIGVTIDIDNVPLSKKYTVAALLAVAIWNGIEMLPIIFFTFNRFSGLYFCSMLAADAGVLIYATGFILNNFQVTGNQTLPTILTCAAWIPMVSAQSLILYSRLHLINLNESIRRWVLIMIIFNGITMHTATAVTTIGANGKAAALFYEPYGIMERMQVTVFFIQELILSSLYLWRAKSFLDLYQKHKKRGGTAQREMRSMVTHLILSNVIVVVLDITILVLEFMGLYFIQVAYKAFVYSVKLKCEVGILGRLVDFVKATTTLKHHLPSCSSHHHHHHPCFGGGGGGGVGLPPCNRNCGCTSLAGQPLDDWNNFQLSSQMEREWETTLRNTFGVPMEVDVQMDVEASEKVGLGTKVIGMTCTSGPTAATTTTIGDDGGAEDRGKRRRSRSGGSRSRSPANLSWPLRSSARDGDLDGSRRNSAGSSTASVNSGRSVSIGSYQRRRSNSGGGGGVESIPVVAGEEKEEVPPTTKTTLTSRSQELVRGTSESMIGVTKPQVSYS